MSRRADGSDQRVGGGPESGLEALRQSPAFRGPADPLDEHDHANDHLALLYDSHDKQFAAAIPFIRQGLDRGEQCLYVADDTSRKAVLAAMRTYGIDVDAALESGALSVLTPAETYCRTGEFDRDAMLEFWEDTLEQARDEAGYTGLRAAAEMTWALDEETGSDELAEYEAVLNSLYQDEDYTVLCQYNRERFSTEVIHDVIKTHPHLVIDNTVSRNIYYTPPEQFFDSEDVETKVNRMTQSLQEHTEAKTKVHEHKEGLRELYEVAAGSNRSFEEKLHAIFELGCDRFDLELGGIARIDPETDLFEVEAISGDHEYLEPGVQVALSETYCHVHTDDRESETETEIIGIINPGDRGFHETTAYTEFGVQSYIGTRIELEAESDRTLFFISSEPRTTAFSDAERNLTQLMGQWIQYELERQHREQELRERTDHLNALIETTPECIKTVAPDGTLLQMNPAGLEMVEADSASDVTGGCVYDLIAPEDRDRFREFNERICRGESGTFEFDIVGLDGTRRHMESHAAPLHRSDGSTVQVALTRDVTDQVERKAELHRAKNRFETVFERSNDAMLLFDPDRDEFIEVNATALEILGYERDDLLARGPTDLHPHQPEQIRAFLDTLAENGHGWTEDLSWRTKDGETVPIEISVSAFELENRSVMLAIVRDITDRKNHERYQRELYDIIATPKSPFDEKLNRLLELGRERFGLENGYFNRINAGPHEFEVVEAVGPHDLIEPGAVDSLKGTYCETHLSSTEPLAVADVGDAGLDDLRAHHQYGLEAYFAATVHVGSREYGTLCFASETPREQPFTEVERTFLDLMAQCLGYELEREHREQALKESNERLEQFAYAASHDLQEPLRMVSSYLQLVESRYADAFDEDGEEFLEYAIDGADRMRDMIDGLLKYSRVETRGDPLEPIELETVLEEVLEDLQIQIDETSAEITVDDLPCVEGDRNQLRQLFQNLLENAITYSGSSSPQVHIEANYRTQKWEISVRDNGIGIEPNDQDHIFDIFKRLHSRDTYDGTGLGLALCERIIERHDGEIWVESEPDEGATFSFTLPALDRSSSN